MSTDNVDSVYQILVVEDDQTTREYICGAIQCHPSLNIVQDCGDLATARKFLESSAPDVLLTDLALPDGDGLTLIREVKRIYPICECMVISVFGTENRVLSAIAAGATGYLLKDESYERIGEAIISLIKGGSPMSPNIARHLLDKFHTHNSAKENGLLLTERETQILAGLAKGYTFQELAKQLIISPHTVGTHVKNIYRKLEVRSRSEAVFEAVQLGLISIR